MRDKRDECVNSIVKHNPIVKTHDNQNSHQARDFDDSVL